MGEIRTLTTEEVNYKQRLKDLGILVPVESNLKLSNEHIVIGCGDGKHARDTYAFLEERVIEDELGRSFYRISDFGAALTIHPDNPIDREENGCFSRARITSIRTGFENLGCNAVVGKHHWPCGMALKYNINLPQSIEWFVRGMRYVQDNFPRASTTALMHFCLPALSGEKNLRRRSYEVVIEEWNKHHLQLLQV